MVNELKDSTSFGFNGQFFEQVYGTAMGSPISPIVADFAMTDLEDNCLNKLSFKPIFYKRYVDDIITEIPSKDVDLMLHCFNSYHPRLQFTFETELNKTINFLGIKIIRKSKGLVFDSYIKPTSSERFIDFNSSHPKCQKVDIICHLVDKAVNSRIKNFMIKIWR